MTVKDILVRSRDTLADLNGDRWSDERLIRLIDEAQKTIAIATRCLRDTIKIPIYNEQSNYILPEDYIGLTRLSYDSTPLQILTPENIDIILGPKWELDKGSPEFAVISNINRGIVKLVPTPVLNNTDDTIYLTVSFYKLPTTIISINDELDLEELYKTMIVRYVTGYAFRDDMDSQNRAFGTEELNSFNAWLEEIKIQTSKDMSNHNIYLTQYRSGF